MEEGYIRPCTEEGMRMEVGGGGRGEAQFGDCISIDTDQVIQ